MFYLIGKTGKHPIVCTFDSYEAAEKYANDIGVESYTIMHVKDYNDQFLGE
jgi:predicted RecB family endonuclease